MHTARLLIAFLVTVAPQSALASQADVLQEPWQQPYQDADASGTHVIGYWSFDGPDPLADKSGHGHNAVIEGASIDTNGKFDSCLRSARGWPIADKPHRIRIPNAPGLSPAGAFSLEMWINADAELTGYPESILVDKKYVADTDYQLSLGRAQKDGKRQFQAVLGFGNHSVTWLSSSLRIEPGTWYHVAFTYNGKGLGQFFVNGHLCGVRQEDGVAGMQPGTHILSIGDRIGSYFHGFPGRIDQVRLTEGAREFGPMRVERVSDRTCFRRMEPNVSMRFRLTNLQRTPTQPLALRWQLEDVATGPAPIGPLEPGASSIMVYQLDTRLRPDTYHLGLRIGAEDGTPDALEQTFPFQIVPRMRPDQFPVVMWGAGPSEIDRLKQIGFTHALGIGADYDRIWKAGQPTQAADDNRVRSTRAALDRALSEGVSFAASLAPGASLRNQMQFQRVNRDQKPQSGRPDICGLFPEIREFCFNVGASVAQTYGDLPAFNAALLHTEVRDAAQPCFHPQDFAAYRAATGTDIPIEVTNRWGVDYTKLPAFPENRVVADDNEIYRYYQWYWKFGDGWNHLNSELRRGLDQMERPDFWTWHDPAARVASVYGSGGNVDVISQWTYSYPDPIRIGVATDELLAMARGAAQPQQVMKMTQVIWYRSQTAPMTKPDATSQTPQAKWEREQPDAPFITIAPMHLREAFWTKIARPIKGIMYHGWQSLVPVEGSYGYRYTNPATQVELQRLIHNVIQPLGPTLLHIPSIQSDCAFYASFAAQVFAQRGTYGWGGKWIGDAYQVTMWSGLQPEIVFDETICQHGLDAYKILFMLDCDVITQSIAARIHQFQQRGGIVIGDDHTAPDIKCDIILPVYKRTGQASMDKQQLVQRAVQLREALKLRYVRYIDTDNHNVIPYRRRYQQTDYVFLINDARQYGTYVGQHGLVMEDGLPSRSTVSLTRGKSFVYDLVAHQPLPCGQNDTKIEIPVQLDPCAGRLLMVTPQPINSILLQAPKEVSRGDHTEITIRVVDPRGELIRAIVPVHVTIEKPDARNAEFTGYWTAVNGQVRIPVDVASNDPAGVWTVHAEELASGQTAATYFKVTGDTAPAPLAPTDKGVADPVQPNG